MQGSKAKSVNGPSARGAFTLIELLVVIGIIIALSLISLPAIRGLSQSNTMTSGTQQLVDDLMLARHKAMVNRTTVHVVFVPPWANDPAPASLSPAQWERERTLWEKRRGGAYTTYALYAERTLGDQPGQRKDRYLTEWRTLPEGVFIAEYEYNKPAGNFNTLAAHLRPFATNWFEFPYPTEDSPATLVLPAISFDENGSVFQYELGTRNKRHRDEYIHLAKGSVLVARMPDGTVQVDAKERPPWNSSNDFHRIRIDALSGRAKLERPEIKVDE